MRAVPYAFRHGDSPLAGYTIQRAVGRGGFGEVYYALSDSGREVALKYLRDNPMIEYRGVQSCMNLKSPYLVSIFDMRKSSAGEWFVIMEYVAGPSLRDLLVAQPQGLGPQKAAFFTREIAKGLAYLHDRGIVHRDLKPGNIFYDEGYVKIGDYGLSKSMAASQHSLNTVSVGTVHYMAPEVGSGQYHRGIDIYALGVILYEMLVGRVPFEGSSMAEVLIKHLQQQPEMAGLPAAFAPVVRKALEKNPQERYQNVNEMIEDLLEVEEVRNSVAGFNPVSLSVAVRRAADIADSPVPSPNPLRVAGGPEPRVLPAAIALRPLPIEQWSREAASGHIRYAGFWIRSLAALVDVVVVATVAGLLSPGGSMFLLLAILYDGILIGRWNGQTLGKRACGIKVISNDGRVCGLGQAFGRAAAGILSTLTLCIGYVIAAFDDQKRALHDRLAGTLAVYALR